MRGAVGASRRIAHVVTCQSEQSVQKIGLLQRLTPGTLAWTMAAAAGPVGRGVTIIKLTWTVTLAVLASAVQRVRRGRKRWIVGE
jgi:hypothetical protein